MSPGLRHPAGLRRRHPRLRQGGRRRAQPGLPRAVPPRGPGADPARQPPAVGRPARGVRRRAVGRAPARGRRGQPTPTCPTTPPWTGCSRRPTSWCGRWPSACPTRRAPGPPDDRLPLFRPGPVDLREVFRAARDGLAHAPDVPDGWLPAWVLDELPELLDLTELLAGRAHRPRRPLRHPQRQPAPAPVRRAGLPRLGRLRRRARLAGPAARPARTGRHRLVRRLARLLARPPRGRRRRGDRADWPAWAPTWPGGRTPTSPPTCRPSRPSGGPSRRGSCRAARRRLDFEALSGAAVTVVRRAGGPSAAPTDQPPAHSSRREFTCGQHQVPDQAEQAEREGARAQQVGQDRPEVRRAQVPRGRRGRRRRQGRRSWPRTPPRSSTRPPPRASSTRTRPRTASPRSPRRPPLSEARFPARPARPGRVVLHFGPRRASGSSGARGAR